MDSEKNGIMTIDPHHPTRWGIISTGLISNDFCLALRTFPAEQHQIVAVGARSLEDANNFAKKHNISGAYGCYEDVANDPNVDIVYIGTIHPLHCKISKMMLLAGKAVLCEKPMAMSAAEAQEVINTAHETQKLFVEGFWSRFFPVYDQLHKEIVAGNSVGEIRLLTVEFGVKFDWETNKRMSEKEFGGGVTLDIGCYAIQMANFVFHQEYPERIVASGVLHETGVDKQVSVTLHYKNDKMAVILVSGECILSNSATIYGTDGQIRIPAKFWCPLTLETPNKIYQYQLPETSEPTYFENSAGFAFEINRIREALIEGKTETSQMTHDDSILIAKIQDEILNQLGVRYE